jgi:prepilin-type N-terminal cleavage/methylation domain-containing protein/prepilin-type processing-associated H-X9-DG protein
MNARRKGFTLIELLVVVAIIAILMAVLMPALRKAKEQAQSAACQGNLKGFTLAVQMYAQEYDDGFPEARSSYFRTNSALPGDVSGGTHRRWCNEDVNLRYHPDYGSVFFGYLSNAKSLICPTFRRLAKSGYNQSDFDNDIATGVTNYNPWMNYTQNAYLGPKNSPTNPLVNKLMNIRIPAETFVFADEGPFVEPGYNTQGLNDTALFPVHPTSEAPNKVKQMGSKWNVKPGPDGIGTFTDIIAGFHNAPSGNRIAGKGNCAFADGHVAAASRMDSFPLAYPK